MSIEDAYNFRRVDDRLTTSGLVSFEQLHQLHDDGYDAVIDLLPTTHEHAIPDEAGIVRSQGVEYISIPVDFEAPAPEDFAAFADALDARPGQKIHVHCAANYRVSVFYSLYALRNGWCTETEADQLVLDLWDPSEHPAWQAFVTEERARMRRASP